MTAAELDELQAQIEGQFSAAVLDHERVCAVPDFRLQGVDGVELRVRRWKVPAYPPTDSTALLARDLLKPVLAWEREELSRCGGDEAYRVLLAGHETPELLRPAPSVDPPAEEPPGGVLLRHVFAASARSVWFAP